MDLDQLRAQNAFSSVQNLSGHQAEFLALARKLPFMLHVNGLLATWGHLLAKAKKAPENELALKVLTQHLLAVSPRLRLDVASPGEPQQIFDHWIDAQGGHGLSGLALRKNTAEALAFTVWLKRAAEALCDAGERKTP